MKQNIITATMMAVASLVAVVTSALPWVKRSRRKENVRAAEMQVLEGENPGFTIPLNLPPPR